MSETKTVEDWDLQEAEESFLLLRFVCDGVGYDDLAQWRKVGTWAELQERALLSDAYWEERELGYVGEAVSYTHLGNGDEEQKEHVIEDILRQGQVIMLAGEEGAGKSTLAHELAHGLIKGTLLGEHAAPTSVERVIIVDVEQSEEDACVIRDDLTARHIALSPEVYWLDAVGRAFDVEEDKTWLREQVRMFKGRKVIILDTATEAVTKPREDDSVKQLFILVGNLMRNDDVVAVIFLGQARKRSQDAEGDRRFDDLFGSRVWKGRSSAVFWVEGETFVVWKQRGSHLEKRWGGKDGRRYAQGRLLRTEGETLLLGPLGKDERRTRILETLREHPLKFSKTSLIEEHFKVTGETDRKRWREDVHSLLDAGDLVAEGKYHKLRVAEGGQFSKAAGF